MKIVLFFLLATQLWIIVPRGCYASKSEKELIEHLMKDYNPTVRPVKNNNDVINVAFQLSLQQIVDLDVKNQLMTTSLYMTNAWHDVTFVWNPTDYDNITTIRLPAKLVWKPDIFVYNSALDSFDSLLQTNVIITYDGLVSWLPPGIFKTTCDVDIQYFPFDQQRCTIKFGSWTHQENSLNLQLDANGTADTSSYQESGAWDLIKMTGKVNRVKYDCCDDRFIDATYTVVLRRKTAFYIYNLVLPCVLVCALTILTFIFPADAGERMTLGITVLLAMVVFLQIVADNLPPTGATPLLGKYFLCTVFMVSLSVIASVLSMSLHYSDPTNSDGMPAWVEAIFLGFLPKMLCMKMPKKFEKKDRDTEEKDFSGDQNFPLIKVGQRLGGHRSEFHDNSNSVTGLAKQLQHTEKQIATICDDLHDITSRMKDDDADDEITQKWKFAARVMDRFCLVFFFIFFLASTVFTLGCAPTPEDF